MTDAPRRSTLQDRVHDRLYEEIWRGDLAPGAHLRVVPIAQRFGVSQAPVREALRRLTDEGLAVTEPFIGTVVKQARWEEVEDIFLVRSELEAFAVRQVMTTRPHRLAPARRALRDLERAVRGGQSIEILDADLAFHRAVCEATGSPLTVELWTITIKRFRSVRLLLDRHHPDTYATVGPSHRALMDALDSGEVSLAEQAFREHLRAALANYASRRSEQPALYR